MTDFNDIEHLANPKDWQTWQDNNKDGYGGACVAVAYHAMKMLDDSEYEISDPHKLICDADDKANTGGITGYMAGAAASMISKCHERGDEFRRIWNGDVQIGDEGDKANESGGVLNPALLNITT